MMAPDFPRCKLYGLPILTARPTCCPVNRGETAPRPEDLPGPLAVSEFGISRGRAICRRCIDNRDYAPHEVNT